MRKNRIQNKNLKSRDPLVKTIRSRRPFTLLELFISISILSLVGGLLLFPIKSVIKEHQFQESSKKVRLLFRELQAFALNYQSDMELELYKKGDIFYCSPMTDEPLAFLKPVVLDGVSQITFNGKALKKPLRFKVFASGRILPEGELLFSQEKSFVKIGIHHALQLKTERGKKI
jgi:type II secretory pathway pseudopilin PulG